MNTLQKLKASTEKQIEEYRASVEQLKKEREEFEKAKREHEEQKNKDQKDLQERVNALNAKLENRPQPVDEDEEASPVPPEPVDVPLMVFEDQGNEPLEVNVPFTSFQFFQ